MIILLDDAGNKAAVLHLNRKQHVGKEKTPNKKRVTVFPQRLHAKKAAHFPAPAYMLTPVMLDDVVKFFLYFKPGDTITTYQSSLAKARKKFTYVNTKRVFAMMCKKNMITRTPSTFQVHYHPTTAVDVQGRSVFDAAKAAVMLVDGLR